MARQKFARGQALAARRAAARSDAGSPRRMRTSMPAAPDGDDRSRLRRSRRLAGLGAPDLDRRRADSRAAPRETDRRPAPCERAPWRLPTSRARPRPCRSSSRRSRLRRAAAAPPGSAPRATPGPAARPQVRKARRERVPPSRRSSISIARVSSIGPVSRPASICMIVMPVVRSPASMARAIGAAPRQRGSSDACTLMAASCGVPVGPQSVRNVEHRLRQDQAVGRDDQHVGTRQQQGVAALPSPPDPFRSEAGVATGSPCASASDFTGLGVSRRPRPEGRSGCVSTSGSDQPRPVPLQSGPPSDRAAKSGVPANTMRIAAF